MRQALILMLLLLMTGCGRGLPQPREMGNMALMRTMAVDAGEEVGIKVTVSSGDEEPLTLSAQRDTVSGACQAVRTHGENSVFLGHVERLLLGERLAVAGGVLPTLKYFSRDEELGLGTEVWLVRGEAGEEAAFQGGAGLKRTAGEVLTDLMEDGCSFLPVVGGGYGIVDRETLRGWLTGDAALGLELVQGYPIDDLMELSHGAVELDWVALTCTPVVEEREVAGLDLDLRLAAHLEESVQEPPDLMNVKEEIAVQVERWVTDAVKRSQMENLDYMGLCRMAGASRPEYWKLLRSQGPESFSEWSVSIKCTVTMTDQRR